MRYIPTCMAIIISAVGGLAFADHAVRETMGLSPEGGFMAAGIVRADSPSARPAVYASVLGYSSELVLPRVVGLAGLRNAFEDTGGSAERVYEQGLYLLQKARHRGTDLWAAIVQLAGI